MFIASAPVPSIFQGMILMGSNHLFSSSSFHFQTKFPFKRFLQFLESNFLLRGHLKVKKNSINLLKYHYVLLHPWIPVWEVFAFEVFTDPLDTLHVTLRGLWAPVKNLWSSAVFPNICKFDAPYPYLVIKMFDGTPYA